jgi:hypothetical protein
MCSGSPRYLLSIQEMIVWATVEHTTGHDAESTNTQQVTSTQLEHVVHVDEDKTDECLIRHNIHNKGSNLLDEDGSIIRIGSSVNLAIAMERES